MKGSTWILVLASACAPSDTPATGGDAGIMPSVSPPDAVGGSDGPSAPQRLDRFGIPEIYPTRAGGPEWFLDMTDPTRDSLFIPKAILVRQPDGSWRIAKDEVRMDVGSLDSGIQWKNVEMTGYARMVEIVSASNGGPQLVWFARGVRHSTNYPCLGTSVKGYIKPDGSAFWKKELWHTGGYTSRIGNQHLSDFAPPIGRWIGFKVVQFNLPGDVGVRVQLFVDKNADGNWTLESDSTDTGEACAPLDAFYPNDCRNPLTNRALGPCDVVTWSGPFATFRSDGLTWDFKDLSIREIEPPR